MEIEKSDKPVNPLPAWPGDSPALRRLIDEVRVEDERADGQQSSVRSPHNYNRQHNRHNR